eukprot:Rhum_TRINITY_DN13705_c0_g2::Rhum_TRINITY_DN13705_c0_g2_i1::g.63244::m.63244
MKRRTLQRSVRPRRRASGGREHAWAHRQESVEGHALRCGQQVCCDPRAAFGGVADVGGHAQHGVPRDGRGRRQLDVRRLHDDVHVRKRPDHLLPRRGRREHLRRHVLQRRLHPAVVLVEVRLRLPPQQRARRQLALKALAHHARLASRLHLEHRRRTHVGDAAFRHHAAQQRRHRAHHAPQPPVLQQQPQPQVPRAQQPHRVCRGERSGLRLAAGRGRRRRPPPVRRQRAERGSERAGLCAQLQEGGAAAARAGETRAGLCQPRLLTLAHGGKPLPLNVAGHRRLGQMLKEEILLFHECLKGLNLLLQRGAGSRFGLLRLDVRLALLCPRVQLSLKAGSVGADNLKLVAQAVGFPLVFGQLIPRFARFSCGRGTLFLERLERIPEPLRNPLHLALHLLEVVVACRSQRLLLLQRLLGFLHLKDQLRRLRLRLLYLLPARLHGRLRLIPARLRHLLRRLHKPLLLPAHPLRLL